MKTYWIHDMTRKVRSRKNRIKPASRRSKKKSDHDDNVPMNNPQELTQSQVGVGNFTQESVVSNLYMLQPWRVYPTTSQFTQFQVGVGNFTQESVVSNPYILQSWGVYPPAQQFTQSQVMLELPHNGECIGLRRHNNLQIDTLW